MVSIKFKVLNHEKEASILSPIINHQASQPNQAFCNPINEGSNHISAIITKKPPTNLEVAVLDS